MPRVWECIWVRTEKISKWYAKTFSGRNWRTTHSFSKCVPCACVCTCVRVIAMCLLGLTIEFIPRRNLNLQLDAFCLDLSNPLLWPDTHTHTRTEPIHPSPWHDCSYPVTLCSNPSAMSKTAITTGRRGSRQSEQEVMAWHTSTNCCLSPSFLPSEGITRRASDIPNKARH